MRIIVFIACMLFTLNVVAAPKVQEVRAQETGIKALLVENRANPIISVVIAFKTGGANDAIDKQGLSDLMAGTLERGAGDMNAEEFARILYEKSIQISFSASKESFIIRLQTLRNNYKEAFAILRKVLLLPHFKVDEIDKAKEEIKATIALQKESPSSEIMEMLLKEIFLSHPYSYGNDEVLSSLANITRFDLQGYMARFAKDNMLLSVSGDISAVELKSIIDVTFDFMAEKSVGNNISKPEFSVKSEPVIIKKDTPQSVVVYSIPWIKRSDEGFYAGFVLNYILGGAGMESVLMKELREKEGLTYGASSFLAEFAETSVMIGTASVAKENSQKAVGVVKKILSEVEISEYQLTDAKDYLTGAFPLMFTSNMDTANMLYIMQKYNLGNDYLLKRNDYIKSVTLDDINALAKKMLDVKKSTFVVMGE